MHLVIRTPATELRLAKGIASALRERDLNVSVAPESRWDAEHGEDVELIIRGPHTHEPSAGRFSILWIVGNPLSVTKAELDAHDLVLTASSLLRALLSDSTRTPIELARRCVDTAIFCPPAQGLEEQAAQRTDIVYVGDAQEHGGEVARWLAQTGASARVFGTGWDEWGVGHLVERQSLADDELAELYRSARLSLIDHANDHRLYGIIDDRVFGAVACGLPVLSDSFPELRDVFSDSLLYARDAETFRAGLLRCEDEYADLLSLVHEQVTMVRERHSIAARAAAILEWIESPPGRSGEAVGSGGVALTPAAMGAVLENQNALEQERTDHLESMIRQTSHALEQAQQAAAEAEKRCAEEAQRAVDWITYAERLGDDLRRVYASRSWKITRPLRTVTALARGQGGREGVPGRVADPPTEASLDGPAATESDGGSESSVEPGAPRFVFAEERFSATGRVAAANRGRAGAGAGNKDGDLGLRGGIARVWRGSIARGRRLPRPVRQAAKHVLLALGLGRFLPEDVQPQDGGQRGVQKGPQGAGESRRTAQDDAALHSRVEQLEAEANYWQAQTRLLREEMEYLRARGPQQSPGAPHPSRERDD